MAVSLTPELNVKNAMIAKLLQQGTDTSPVQHWTQGAARLAQALAGGAHMVDEERQGREASGEMFKIWQGQQGGMPPQHPLGPVTSGPRPQSAPPAFAPPAPDMAAPRVADAFSAFPDAPQSPGGAPQPAPQPTPQMAGGQAPAAIRFNNPGAQYPGPSANAFGATGSATIGGGHKIAQFPDPVSGAAAQFHLLNRAYAGMPLAAAINKWSGGNNSGQYVAAVSRATGITPDTPITPELLQSPQGVALVRAMAKHETGREFPMAPEQWQQAQSMAFSGQPPVQMASAGGPQSMPQMPQGQQPPQQMAQAQQPNAAMIQQMINHPNPRVRAMGNQMMQQEMARQPKDSVAGDYAIRTHPNGRVEVLFDATKATDDQRNLKDENASRAKRGLPPLSITEFKAAITAAGERGKQEGEAQASLESIRSKMPGLESVVRELDGLAEKATYTLAGQGRDILRRQMGASPTEGATSRARYIAMVDNQVLPLLRDTFGAQFTQKEGETLRATLGNADLSPQEKQQVLKSFIEQKRRDVEALVSRTGGAPAQGSGGAPQETKTLGGKTYVKIGNQWFTQ